LPKKLKPFPTQVPNDGIIISDLYDEPISLQSFTDCIERLGANYGINYFQDQNGKVLLLFEEITRAGWSNDRLKETIRWLIHQNKFATWTLADFFSAPLAKIYPYSKYLSERQEKGNALNLEINWYIINGSAYWAYKISGDLPFPKNDNPKPEKISTPQKEVAPLPEELKSMKKKWMVEPEHRERTGGVKPLTELMGIQD